jgi:glutamate/tyrosine decarboxylase-like PLP-dependent enzyme
MNQRYQRRRQHFSKLMSNYLGNQSDKDRLHLEGDGTDSIAAWFMGPRAENGELFKGMINRAIQANMDDRNTLYRNDPPYVTEGRRDKSYHDSVARMMGEFEKLLTRLKGSVPFFSYRYQAHMNWDLTLPSMAGYFAAMLYNQNNVALEASPVTSVLERLVGDDICKMLGFDLDNSQVPRPWAHITCDGSVANLEAMWAARNLKYYALSLKAALVNENALKPARHIKVQPCCGEMIELIQLDAWALVNLPVDTILELPTRIEKEYGIDSVTITQALDSYLLQTLGLATFMSSYASDLKAPAVMGPATKHYSWPKNAALTGLGKACFVNVVVDRDARMDCRDLEKKLAKCLDDKQPVAMVVVVLGSTEESAVDPLAKVVELRDQFRKRGLDFVIHVDAAWGGYFASILREPDPSPDFALAAGYAPAHLQVTPALRMSRYVTSQYEAIPHADSVTIDPHKAGYVPYAAGGLCYRNGVMRNLVAFLAPEVYHGNSVDANMGIFGVEGSKSGAAAAGVYLSHRVIRPNRSGYGKLLGQALFNSKRFYSGIVTMATESDDFVVVPVHQIPTEREGKSQAEITAQLEQIRTSIVDRQNNDIVADKDAMALLEQLGSDQIIITYGLNFKCKGVLNTDPVKANDFMHEVFTRLSLQADNTKTPDLMVTTSEFGPAEYGTDFVTTYMKRLGLDNSQAITMNFLSSTTMCPWLTATAKGDFVPTLIQAFRQAVEATLATGSYT